MLQAIDNSHFMLEVRTCYTTLRSSTTRCLGFLLFRFIRCGKHSRETKDEYDSSYDIGRNAYDAEILKHNRENVRQVATEYCGERRRQKHHHCADVQRKREFVMQECTYIKHQSKASIGEIQWVVMAEDAKLLHDVPVFGEEHCIHGRVINIEQTSEKVQ
eukprot:gb/GECG01013623.1/.p1 GENE.gb/GECG01013623.1/~~gb/GECG01013623.1/.p1  ORF type:complete len:160 (+),score=17.07 gb/GECG01013623.1/:1-480(+)